MFEWRVNQIRLSMMERVLNHMEKQGYEVQKIMPVERKSDAEQEVILLGRKVVKPRTITGAPGAPAVTDKDLDSVYGKRKNE